MMSSPSLATATLGMDEIDCLSARIELPCGLVLSNRLVKAAMEPCLAKNRKPSENHFKLYSEWSNGGFGLMVTENIQVAEQYIGSPHDIVMLPSDLNKVPESWSTWAKSCRTPTLVQLCHAGLQSSRGCGRYVWEPAISPSSMRLSMGDSLLARALSILLFNTSRMMDKTDIKRVVQQFADGALLAHRCGFLGVQLHCSHGYLLAQFLSPRTNKRNDEYGNTPYNRLRILFEIIDAIRASLPASFCLSVKLNSADFVAGGLTEADALQNVEWIVQHGGVDLIEISGGTYENVVFSDWDSPSDEGHRPKDEDGHSKGLGLKIRPREAFFANFAARARSRVQEICPKNTPSILLTGGFRTRAGMAAAIDAGHTDMIGIGRPACLDPHIASRILDPDTPEPICPTVKIRGISFLQTMMPIKLMGAGFSTTWHAWQLQRISKGKKVDLQCSALAALRALAPSKSSLIYIIVYTATIFGLITSLNKLIKSY